MSYIQETGRASQDGLDSIVVLALVKGIYIHQVDDRMLDYMKKIYMLKMSEIYAFPQF